MDNLLLTNFANSLTEGLSEPVLVFDSDLRAVALNESFCRNFDVPSSGGQDMELSRITKGWDFLEQDFSLEGLVSHRQKARDLSVVRNKPGRNISFQVNITVLELPDTTSPLYLLSCHSFKDPGKDLDYRELLNEVLSEAPALVCTLKGPDHVFELANDKYLKLVGNRDIIGKRVREALPEVENQGFFEILDKVYETGESHSGTEVPVDLYENGRLQQTLVDFLYQPIKDKEENTQGIFVHAIDVTEKVLARKKLEDSEKELKKLLDTVPSIIWMADENGENTFLSYNWQRYTGIAPRDSRGQDYIRAIHPDDRDRVREAAEKARREKSAFKIENRLLHKDGSYRWVINSGVPTFDNSGNYTGMVGTTIDVHELKEKEQELFEKEHRLRSIVEEATVATAIYVGEEMNIELANDAMIQVWGKDTSVIGKNLREALPELEGQPFFDLLQTVFRTGNTYWGKEDRVDLMIGNQMRTGYFNFTYKPLRNKQGEIYGILNMAIDVTEMVQSKNLLRESEQRFRQMADLMPEKVIKIDDKGRPIYFNKGWVDYTGLNIEELKSNGLLPVVHPEDREEFEKNWETSLRTGHSFEMEVRIRNSEGKYEWHISRGEPMRNKAGKVKRWIATTTEIQKLKEEEKRKEDFLKMVSHELKTPVTSIKGYVQLLLSLLSKQGEAENYPLPVKPSLERIDHQITRLTRLISEMLDLSRLEENKLELQKEDFLINDLVVQTVQDIKLTNTQHEIEVFHHDTCKVNADKDRIGQVLINFITNAIKYSPESRHIEVHIRSVEDDVAVSVVDQGIGIEQRNFRNIFKRFYRVGIGNEETYSGFGIGLYLAKEIIDRHKGHIEVKSEKGKGSGFTFFLSKAS